MANAAYLYASTPGTIRNQGNHSVWFKRRWADAWTWVPYVQCKRAIEQVGPEVGTAEFIWDFGENKQHFDPDFLFYYPVLVENAYVMVVMHNEYGSWPLWIGIIQDEEACPQGSLWPAGTQSFVAYSVEHLLSRNYIRGSWTQSGYIEREVRFNRKDARGLSEQGNRSSAVDGTGTHYFSDDGELWSNRNIIEHCLARFVEGGIQFRLIGAVDPLDNIKGEETFFGQSVLDVITKLVDRRYGLGYRFLISSAPGGICYVYVFSQLAYPLVVGDVGVPANPVQGILTIYNDHSIDPVLGFSSRNQFDSIEVIGDNLLGVGTFSFADETLIKGWTDEEQADYEDPDLGNPEFNDVARQSDELSAVYQRFRVPDDWDGYLGNGTGGIDFYNAHPMVYDDGSIDWDAQSTFWMGERKFNKDTPLPQLSQLDGAPIEYRRGYAMVQDWDTNVYFYVEKVSRENLPSAHIMVSDREMAFWLKSVINHVYGLNHFENVDTDKDPVFDYEDVLATLAFKVDTRIKVRCGIPGQYITETGKTKTILVPDAQFWFVVPNTVTDVVDGALVRSYGAEYTILRDDRLRLLQLAALAQVWYSVARGTADFTYKYITPAFPTSSLLIGAQGNWHAELLGTVVTRKVWNLRENTTEIITGYDELAFGGDIVKIKKAQVLQ